jgi:CheY-like chemotaxis protein
VSSNPVPRVFVVDDEHVIASTLAAILKMHGYSATFFTSPVEALAAARSTAPDLLISDVAMPGISGIDLAIQMRAQYPTCKVLLFSGQAATFDLLEDARARGHDFDLLLKPVPPTEFLLEVRKMVNGIELKGQASGSVPDTPKRSLGARRRFRGVRSRQSKSTCL